MDYNILQNYWWLIISLLGAVLVFLLFVQGGQSMLISVKDRDKRSLLINSLGRKWEFTFTTLVTFGGAFFASFPLFYSTSFGGAYWLWMLILFSFVIQAVSYEYRSKLGNVYGTQFYDVLLFINGIVGPVLLGVAVAGMFFGAEFNIYKNNIVGADASAISQWGPLHGLEAIACWKNLVFGFMVLFLARTLASLYFINNIDDDHVQKVQHKQLLVNSALFVVLFLTSAALILTSSGVGVDENDFYQWIPYKYLTNLLEMWWVFLTLLAGVVLVLFGIGKSLLQPQFKRGIWFAGIGTVLVVMALLWTVGFNNTAYYPSINYAGASLTIRNSSSSHFTLTAMSIVSLLVPFVLAYIIYVWRAMDKDSITTEEIAGLDPDDKY